jgi:hypothetical protein
VQRWAIDKWSIGDLKFGMHCLRISHYGLNWDGSDFVWTDNTVKTPFEGKNQP